MDWKTITNNVLLVGLFVAMLTMFNQLNNRLDTIQAEMNRTFRHHASRDEPTF